MITENASPLVRFASRYLQHILLAGKFGLGTFADTTAGNNAASLALSTYFYHGCNQ